jgi:uncharacterized protein
MRFRAGKTAHGSGLFAAESLRPGDFILRCTGPVINYPQVERKKHSDNPLQIGPYRYIDFRKPGVLANHSCEPNAGIRNDYEMVAIKPIAKGEEIVWDYSCSIENNTLCTFPCGCKSKQCRTWITDFSELPKRTRARYLRLGIVQQYIAKWYHLDGRMKSHPPRWLLHL